MTLAVTISIDAGLFAYVFCLRLSTYTEVERVEVISNPSSVACETCNSNTRTVYRLYCQPEMLFDDMM